MDSPVFARCEKLKKIHIPTNIKSIWSNTFTNCLLEHIQLDEGVRFLYAQAFGGGRMVRTTLKEIRIPKSVRKVDACFNGVDKVYVEGNAPAGLFNALLVTVKDVKNIPQGWYDPHNCVTELYFHDKLYYLPKYEFTGRSLSALDQRFIFHSIDDSMFDFLFEEIPSKEYKQDLYLQMYQITGEEKYKTFLRRSAKRIAMRYIQERNEEMLVEFLKTELISKKSLQELLPIVRKTEMSSATAYLLNAVNKDFTSAGSSFKL